MKANVCLMLTIRYKINTSIIIWQGENETAFRKAKHTKTIQTLKFHTKCIKFVTKKE